MVCGLCTELRRAEMEVLFKTTHDSRLYGFHREAVGGTDLLTP